MTILLSTFTTASTVRTNHRWVGWGRRTESSTESKEQYLFLLVLIIFFILDYWDAFQWIYVCTMTCVMCARECVSWASFVFNDINPNKCITITVTCSLISSGRNLHFNGCHFTFKMKLTLRVHWKTFIRFLTHKTPSQSKFESLIWDLSLCYSQCIQIPQHLHS